MGFFSFNYPQMIDGVERSLGGYRIRKDNFIVRIILTEKMLMYIIYDS